MAADTDVIIVGGGPAGLSAALVLGRACRRVRVFDNGHPRNAAARHVHGYLTRDGIAPAEFLRLAREDLGRYETVSLETASVVAAACEPDGTFAVTLDDARRVTARKLLLATGVVDRVPRLPGLQELYGTSVFHCPFCDGYEFRGQGLAVYGRGRRGVGLSLELLAWSRDIVLCTDGASRLNPEQFARLERNGIAVREERIERLDGRDGRLERIVFRKGEPLERDALVFTTGQRQRSHLARVLGCQFNRRGTVHTGRYESTNIPGLFVAGDASRDVQWVIVAAAEGAEAAFAMVQELGEAELK